MWPWIAIAGLGALHGLNPLCGWPLLACGAGLRRGLPAMAGGHAVSLLTVAAAVLAGVEREWLLLAALALPMAAWPTQRHVGVVLMSFLSATVHGAGLMLVPALVPLCMAGTPARDIVASGSWPLVLLAVGVHLAALLAAAWAAASVATASHRFSRQMDRRRTAHPPAPAAFPASW